MLLSCMSPRPLLLACLLPLALGACAGPEKRRKPEDWLDVQRWERGEVRMQGWLGARILDKIERNYGGGVTDGADEELSQLPSIGGGALWKFSGQKLDFGFEGLFSANWRTNALAFSSSGGATIAVDADILLLDFYGGPFLNLPIGSSTRLYAAAGPLVQFAQYQESDTSSTEGGFSSGFGTGWYARAGLEILVGEGLYAGIGARHSSSSVTLSDEMGTLDLEGTEFFFSMTQAF